MERIEYIHNKNIVHLDIKPANFLVGNPDDSVIYPIDYGISKKYRSSIKGKHITIKDMPFTIFVKFFIFLSSSDNIFYDILLKKNQFKGTFNFSSITILLKYYLYQKLKF